MDCIVHGITKSRTRLSDFHLHFYSRHNFYTFLLNTVFCMLVSTFLYQQFKDYITIHLLNCAPVDIQMDPVYNAEKAMAPHSSTLAWKVPWAEEHGRLQSMGLQRVGHFTFTQSKGLAQSIKQKQIFFWNSLAFSMIQPMLAI